MFFPIGRRVNQDIGKSRKPYCFPSHVLSVPTTPLSAKTFRTEHSVLGRHQPASQPFKCDDAAWRNASSSSEEGSSSCTLVYYSRGRGFSAFIRLSKDFVVKKKISGKHHVVSLSF